MHAVLSFAVLAKDYVYFADGIMNSSDVYAQLSSGTRDIFVTSFPSHTSMRRRASKILDDLLQGQELSRSLFQSGCASALCDVNPCLSNTYF